LRAKNIDRLAVHSQATENLPPTMRKRIIAALRELPSAALDAKEKTGKQAITTGQWHLRKVK